MKHFFYTIMAFMLPCAFMNAQSSRGIQDATRYIILNDGQVVAIPEKYILSEQENKGVCTLSLKGDTTFVYMKDNVAQITDTYTPAKAEVTSFTFTHDANDQVYKDVEATITEKDGTILISADVPVLGKRLRPSFTLTEGALLLVDGQQQVSGQTSHRYTKPVEYTLALPKHWKYEYAETDGAKGFKPFGRPCQVSVKYLTEHSTSQYNVPSVHITFGDGTTWDRTQWIGMTVYDENGNSYNTKENWIEDCTFRLDGAGIWPDIETVEGCEVRGRGNSTWAWDPSSKNPYRIKFPKKNKQSPFNLTKDRQWVFISNKQNGSMTTNAIAQKIAAMVDAEALCHMIPVDMYINGHYRGSYCFTEKIGIADNSVAIDETKGALLELDDYYDEDYKFRDASFDLPVNVKDPDFTEEDPERLITFDDVKTSINSLTSTLKKRGDITKHIDMESWAKFWLVNDLVCNKETHHPKSCYLFNPDLTDENETWKMGPCWDFDWAFGYEGSYTYFVNNADMDLFSNLGSDPKPGRLFYGALRTTDAAKRAYYKEWVNFMAEGRLEELMEYIDDYTKFVLPSLEHNNEANVREKDYTDYTAMATKSKQWLKTRAEYIFKNLTVYDINPDIVIPEDYGQPTEIANVAGENEINPLVDVYSISGLLVRSQVPYLQSTNGLAPGMYVIGGKTVIIR